MSTDITSDRWVYETEDPFGVSTEGLPVMAALVQSDRWSGTAEQAAFREAVLAAHLERARRRRGPPRSDLQPSELRPVPGARITMSAGAAARAGELLQSANAAIDAARRSGQRDIGGLVRVTAQSGYRGSDHQQRLWRAYFARHYDRTDRARRALPGGPHSPEAVRYMLDVYRIPERIAAPGHSKHQAGLAIDFRQIIRGDDRVRNSTQPADVARWRGSWFYRWLQQNAARFGFRPYTKEPWHWEFHSTGAEPVRLEPPGQAELETLEAVLSEAPAQGGFEHEEPSMETWSELALDATESDQSARGVAEALSWEDAEAPWTEGEAGEDEAQWLDILTEGPDVASLGEELELGAEESEEPEASFEDVESQAPDLLFEGDGVGAEAWEGVAQEAELLSELLSAGAADALEEAEPGEFGESASPGGQGEVEFEEFTGSEHKAIGDSGSGSVQSSISYGSPPRPLTFGDVVALAGDYFTSYEELRDVAARPGGAVEVAWARWHCLDLKKQGVAEPPATDQQKKAVKDRYFLLASRNLSHFSAGGTAWQTYTLWHARAIADALEAGRTSSKTVWQRALTREAFGDHFLTDMFSGGHVRMPRAAVKDWYGQQRLGTSNQLLGYMARFMYARLRDRQQLPPFVRFVEWISGYVIRSMVSRTKEIGGEAVNSFSLGDIVCLALHDFDGTGLPVLSDVDAKGRRYKHGYPWTAKGDAHLGSGTQGATTKAMATAAVVASLTELTKVRDAGRKVGSRSLSTSQQAAVVKQALGAPIFAARGYVPRENKASSKNVPMIRADGRAPLDWRWGQLGDAAHGAIHEAVRKKIADELAALAGSIRDPVSTPIGTIHGTRGAFLAFVAHLRSEGIVALEKAVGRRGR